MEIAGGVVVAGAIVAGGVYVLDKDPELRNDIIQGAS